jgi:hypothetical protein
MFFSVLDFPGRELGWNASMTVEGHGPNMFANRATEGVPDPAEILDHLQKSTTHGDMELRGNGNIYLWVTPEEEVDVRRDLDELYRSATRHSDWRCVFGTLPAAEAPSGGFMSRADADALVARLKDAHALSLTGLDNARVNAGSDQLRAFVADADVVGGHLDPKVQVIATGRSADLRASTGTNFTWVRYTLAWAEPLPDAPPTAVRNPTAGHIAADTTVTLKKEDGGAATATVSPADAQGHAGESLAITQPSVWLWSPRGECFLPRGSSLALIAEHGADRAIIVLEETTP